MNVEKLINFGCLAVKDNNYPRMAYMRTKLEEHINKNNLSAHYLSDFDRRTRETEMDKIGCPGYL